MWTAVIMAFICSVCFRDWWLLTWPVISLRSYTFGPQAQWHMDGRQWPPLVSRTTPLDIFHILSRYTPPSQRLCSTRHTIVWHKLWITLLNIAQNPRLFWNEAMLTYFLLSRHFVMRVQPVLPSPSLPLLNPPPLPSCLWPSLFNFLRDGLCHSCLITYTMLYCHGY